MTDDFNNIDEYNDYLEMIEDLIDFFILGKNIEEAKQKIEKDRISNLNEILKNDEKKKEFIKLLSKKAIINDSLYNENLKEEAQRILQQKKEVLEETVVVKSMPASNQVGKVGVT